MRTKDREWRQSYVKALSGNDPLILCDDGRVPGWE